MSKTKIEKKKSGFRFGINESDSCRTITIYEYLGKSKEIIVPAYIDGIPVTAISDGAFSGNDKITDVILSEGICSIDDFSFSDCHNLSSINLPESLVSIGFWAFKSCEKIANITLPKGITDIVYNPFDGCNNLSEIVVDKENRIYASNEGILFDKNMTTLIKYPQCKKGDYTVPATVIVIEYEAFSHCNKLTSITIPKDTAFIHNLFLNCEQLAEIIVNKDNSIFSSINGILYNKDENILLRYPQGRKKTDITFPEKLKIIGPNAFDGSSQLSEIILPISLQYIGENAFCDCSHLKTIKLSRKTRVGYKTFRCFSGQIVYLD
jgi:hypothetical protein